MGNICQATATGFVDKYESNYLGIFAEKELGEKWKEEREREMVH